MRNPFENVPLNVKKSFVRGVTGTGCEIYMPVDSEVHEACVAKRDELQEYLDNNTPKPKCPFHDDDLA